MPRRVQHGPGADARALPALAIRGHRWLTGWRLTFGGEDLGWEGALATIVPTDAPASAVFVALTSFLRTTTNGSITGSQRTPASTTRSTSGCRRSTATCSPRSTSWTPTKVAFRPPDTWGSSPKPPRRPAHRTSTSPSCGLGPAARSATDGESRPYPTATDDHGESASRSRAGIGEISASHATQPGYLAAVGAAVVPGAPNRTGT